MPFETMGRETSGGRQIVVCGWERGGLSGQVEFGSWLGREGRGGVGCFGGVGGEDVVGLGWVGWGTLWDTVVLVDAGMKLWCCGHCCLGLAAVHDSSWYREWVSVWLIYETFCGMVKFVVTCELTKTA